MGWEEKCGGAHACGPRDSLVPVDPAGHLSHLFFPHPAALFRPLPVPTSPESARPLPGIPERVGEQGLFPAVHSLPQVSICLWCLPLLPGPPSPLLSTAPQPLCTIAVTESIPRNNLIFRSAPFSLPSMMLGNPNQPGPKRLLQRDRGLGEGPAPSPCVGPDNTVPGRGEGWVGDDTNRETLGTSRGLARAGFGPLLAIPVQSPKLCSHTKHPSHPYPVPRGSIVPPRGRLREKAPREGLAHDVAYSGTSPNLGTPTEGVR